MKKNVILGLDLGTYSIKGAVWRPAGKEKQIGNIVAYAEKPIETGIWRGIIRDVEQVASGVSNLLEDLERISGEKLNQAIVSIGGIHLGSRISRGSVIVSRADRIVTEGDVERALDMAKSMATLNNRRVLHIIPKAFLLDGVGGILNPVDMEGYHLDVDAFIIDGLTPAITMVEKALNLANVEPKLIIASPLAFSRAALSPKDRQDGVVVVDIGASTTTIAVFEEDILAHIAVINQGSYDITKDIAISLKVPPEVAEVIKIDIGAALPQYFEKKESISLSNYIEGENENISKRYIAEIIEAKVEEIFDFIAQELKKIDKLGKLAAGAVILGGGARLKGVENISKRTLKLNSRIASFDNLSRYFPEKPGVQYFTACGLILLELDELVGENLNHKSWYSSIFQKLKNFSKIFLP
jgi:cell division protein FtsA